MENKTTKIEESGDPLIAAAARHLNEAAPKSTNRAAQHLTYDLEDACWDIPYVDVVRLGETCLDIVVSRMQKEKHALTSQTRNITTSLTKLVDTLYSQR